jgi:hypothetical protein
MSGDLWRDEMIQNCKVFVSTSPSWISRIIRKVRGTRWSHTGILINDTFTLEATMKGFEIRRWKKHYQDNPKASYKLYQIRPLYQRAFDEAVAAVMKAHVGSDYSFPQLVGFLWVWAVNRLLGQKVQNPLRDGDGNIICTEGAAYTFIDAGARSKLWAAWIRPKILICDQETLGPDDIERWMDEGRVCTLQEEVVRA